MARFIGIWERKVELREGGMKPEVWTRDGTAPDVDTFVEKTMERLAPKLEARAGTPLQRILILEKRRTGWAIVDMTIKEIEAML